MSVIRTATEAVELEINPLIIGAEGEGATVVDTVLRVTPGGDDR